MMHKTLLLLGLLLPGPLHGYDLHRIVRAHGERYADLKKANVYYLLDSLTAAGDLTVQTEVGARGRRGARFIYALTPAGRAHFHDLLRTVVRSYEPLHAGVDVAVVFLTHLAHAEAVALLEERGEAVAAHRATVGAELGALASRGPLQALAADHLLARIEAEAAWIARALTTLRAMETAGTGGDWPAASHGEGEMQ